LTKYLEGALGAADWFVRSQVLMKKPHWDANHGRFIYTYHRPTRDRVLGLSWTQGRAILTLLAAWEATGRPEYLRSALTGAEYINHLQILDTRSERRFGAIREEVPSSWYVYPRDALEAGLGLLALWRVTGQGEPLYRARAFGDWFIRQAMAEEGGEWTKGAFYLYDEDRERHLTGRSFCLGGGIYFFAWLARATGDGFYLDRGFKPLVRTLLGDYVREDGVILARSRRESAPVSATGHHHGKGERFAGVAVNDDCCGLSVLSAWKELGDERCLELARRYGDWMLECEYPLPNYAATALHALTLMELARASGEPKYSDFAREKLAPLVAERQVLESGDPYADGAFGGEDEPAEWYGPAGARPQDFVNTRVTAYSAGALFKLDGTVPGPYYSAFDWDRPARRAPAELLKPYRV
jgi:hypothetical protein